MFIKGGNPAEAGYCGIKGMEDVSTPPMTGALHIPNTILGLSSGVREDLGSVAGDDGTTELRRSLPDNLSEVRRLIEE